MSLDLLLSLIRACVLRDRPGQLFLIPTGPARPFSPPPPCFTSPTLHLQRDKEEASLSDSGKGEKYKRVKGADVHSCGSHADKTLAQSRRPLLRITRVTPSLHSARQPVCSHQDRKDCWSDIQKNINLREGCLLALQAAELVQTEHKQNSSEDHPNSMLVPAAPVS